MDALEGVMDDNLMKFLNNPTMVNSRKQEILAQVAKEGQFNASTASFLQLLISKGRVSFLKEVIEEFDALYCEATDTQVFLAHNWKRNAFCNSGKNVSVSVSDPQTGKAGVQKLASSVTCVVVVRAISCHGER